MSLLMDALKKAEQEKKEAAKRRELPDDDTGMHLQQRDDEATAEESIQEMPPPDAPPPDQDQTTDKPSALDLSLSPLSTGDSAEPAIPEVSEPASVPATEPDQAQSGTAETGDVTHTMELPQQQENRGLEKETTSEQEVPELQPQSQDDPDQTFHGVELEKTFNAELYEDTVQGEPFKPEDFVASYDETLPGVPAAQLAKDIGTQDQPTPVAAQTVFTATSTIAKPSSGFKMLLIGLASLAVLSALVASYYFTKPVNREIPSPIVARGIETVVTRADVPPAAATSPQTPLPPAPAIMEQAVTATDTVTAGQVSDQQPGQDEEAITGVMDSGSEIETESIAEPTDELVQQMAVADGPPESLPEVIEPPTSLIKITKSSRPQSGNQVLRAAFNAYQSEDYATARLRYADVLKEFPGNRDALLGMAAIELQTGRQDEAINYYLQLLRQNPLDPIARAAVLGQQGLNNSLASISQLKTMIARSMDQPYLYFTLGKLYASRGNWSEAQKAFFDAYRFDSSNPDFALNLAVSLDRIGQQQQALDYYNAALSLAENFPASFEASIVRDRINTLANRN